MLKLIPGDIVLIRGRSWRHRLTRFLLRCEWNHVVVYYKDDTVQELNWRGTQRTSFDFYCNKQIVVLRLQPTDSYTDRRRQAAFMYALDESQDQSFDWVEYVRRCLRLKPINSTGKSVCDAYINKVYREAEYMFKRPGLSTTTTIDCIDLMRKDYGARELLQKHNLVKVYDYRDHLMEPQ